MSKNAKNNNVIEESKNFNNEYRPDCLGDIIGQDSVVEILLNTVLYNQIPNSILLEGDKGTGKTTTARAFSRTINCKNLSTILEPLKKIIKDNPNACISLEDKKKIIRPCGECEACREFAKNSQFAGIIELDAGSEGKIEEVRNLKEELRYAGNFKYKVAIIDESHNMSNGGNTALLKIIEEPPKHVVFIFATTHPDQMLPTILSRSMKLKFNGVNDEEIEKRLRFIVEKEGIQISDDALKSLSSTTNGGVRDAVKNLEQVSLKCKGRTINISDLAGIIEVEPEYVDKIVDLMFNGTIDSLLLGLKDVFSSRKISIENSHLDFFISKIRTMMYNLKSKEDRIMIKEVYKIFISGKERFMYNVLAKTVIETCVLESYDIIEEHKSSFLNKNKPKDPSNTSNLVNSNTGSNLTNPCGSDYLQVSKVDMFARVFKLMFPERTCNLLFNDVEVMYVEEKESICFFAPDEKRKTQIKDILRTDLAQSIKSVADIKGFLLRLKNN